MAGSTACRLDKNSVHNVEGVIFGVDEKNLVGSEVVDKEEPVSRITQNLVWVWCVLDVRLRLYA